MSFDAFETSDGQPVEFVTFINGSTIVRRTNANRAVTPAAFEFLPLEYTRTAPAMSKDSDDTQIRFKVPGDFQIVGLYTNILTSNITSVTIERFHLNDPAAEIQVFWKGTIASVVRNNAMAEILCRPITQGGHEIPRFTYQSACNYFLYDSQTCRLNSADFDFTAPVTSIVNKTEIKITGLRAEAVIIDAGIPGTLTAAELDDYWLGGFVTANGELRRIAEGNIGADPDVIRIAFPFLDLEVSDLITVFAGCLRSADICVRKFDNIINFGGFNNVPEVNPMDTELPSGNAVSAKKKVYWGN